MSSVRFTGGASLTTGTLPTQTSAYHIGGWSQIRSGAYSPPSDTAIAAFGTTGGSSQGFQIQVGSGSTSITVGIFVNAGGSFDFQNFLTGSDTTWFAWVFEYSGSGTAYTFRYRKENDTVWQSKTLDCGNVLSAGGVLCLGTDQFPEDIVDGNVKGFWCQANTISDAAALTASQQAALGIAPSGTNLHWLDLDSATNAGVNGGTAGNWTVNPTLQTDASQPNEAGTAVTVQSLEAPVPKVRAPRPQGWEPIPALPAAGALAPLALSASPVPPRLRVLRLDAWEPLAAIPTISSSIAWGFSGGDTLDWAPPRIDNWEPLAPLQSVAAPALVPYNSPLPSRLRAPRVESWEPLASTLAPVVLSGQPVPARARSARVDAWEPLPALPISSALPLVDFVSPQPCRRQAPRPDSWEPLAALVTSVVTVGGWECQPAPRPAQRASTPQGWEPLVSVIGPWVNCDPPQPARLRAIRPEGWGPLGPIAVAPATVAVCSDPPPVAARRAPRVEPWDPLAAPPALPSLTPLGFTDSPINAQRRARVDAWEPLAAPLAPPAVPPLGFSDAPTNARTRARVDAWEPLPALPAAPAAVPAPFSDSPSTRRTAARVDGWLPIPSLPASPLGPLVCSDAVPPPQRRQQAAGGWVPLAELNGAGVDCFSPEPTRLRQRSALVACWEPLPGVIELPTPEEWGFSAQPRGSIRAARVDAWGVLASLAIGPLLPTQQQFLLQAV